MKLEARTWLVDVHATTALEYFLILFSWFSVLVLREMFVLLGFSLFFHGGKSVPRYFSAPYRHHLRGDTHRVYFMREQSLVT